MGFSDWHNPPPAGSRGFFRRWFAMFAKVAVLALFAVGVGQLGLILFQIVRLRLFS